MICPHCNGTGEVEASLGVLVRERRVTLGLSQEDLASKVHVGRSHIANIETGRTDVPTSTLITLARALNCKPGDLLP